MIVSVSQSFSESGKIRMRAKWFGRRQGKWGYQIFIICVGIIARIGYHLLGEVTPTTDKAVVEGYTYSVSSRIDGTIAGILVSNRQYVKAGAPLAEIDKRDLE